MATIAVWLAGVLPIQALNSIAFWMVEIPLHFAYFATGLPLGTDSNGFLFPNAFGVTFLAASLWLFTFVIASTRALSVRSTAVQQAA
ncbi:MAG: hypothetical protein ABI411_20115, partial [Tahibacter sp.]